MTFSNVLLHTRVHTRGVSSHLFCALLWWYPLTPPSTRGVLLGQRARRGVCDLFSILLSTVVSVALLTLLTCWLCIFWASALAAQASDKRVTFAPEAKPSSATNWTVLDDWGFRFVVDPLRGVHYRVVRELELICRFGGRTRSGSASSTAGATCGPQVRRASGVELSRATNFLPVFAGVLFSVAEV